MQCRHRYPVGDEVYQAFCKVMHIQQLEFETVGLGRCCSVLHTRQSSLNCLLISGQYMALPNKFKMMGICTVYSKNSPTNDCSTRDSVLTCYGDRIQNAEAYNRN